MTSDSELLETSERFYEAVHAVLRGNAAPMLAVWSHSDKVSYCDTRGEIVSGWLALEAYWKHAAASNLGAPTQLSATGHVKHAVVEGALAYVVALEEIRQEGEGEPGVVTARATCVYHRDEDGEWRLLHRHADAAPRASQPPLS